MQRYIVSNKIVVPDFKKVDKRNKVVGQYDSDSDFEDEISVPKIKKSTNKNHENARVTRSNTNMSVDKMNDKKVDTKKSRKVCKYVFRDIVFTAEEEEEFNLGAIHQDNLGHEHRNDSDHFVPPITEDEFIVLKNEIDNVDSQFNGMRKFVAEFVKLILNVLRSIKQQSSEFVEKEV
ncbi:hypothetical protein FXO38_30092 [Capsicum annuum]|nr:hypothetical protein FXO38_30092 [Capsicum annuum]KAF3685432.1 hypothetical protein FXO37_00629 [Capsicum annuum]